MHDGRLARPAPIPPTYCGTNTFTCSFEVENFDVTTEKILAHGGQVAIEKFALPNKCWQGYFIDQDYNTLGLLQVVAYAQ